MGHKIELRPIGQTTSLNDELPLTESFPFPAALTSVLEARGEDAGLQTIDASHVHRSLYNRILVASGMAFGLLWHEERSASSLDLMQVAEHNETIRHAFEYTGYDFEIVEKAPAGDNKQIIWEKMIRSLDQGKGVLAFGIIGPPECSLVSGYDEAGQTLYGWSHFQSHDAADCDAEGRFVSRDWYENLWKIVIVGEKKGLSPDLFAILQRGLKIARATYLNGYFAGPAAYDAWVNYVKQLRLDSLPEEEQKTALGFLRRLVVMHVEAREALASFLRDMAAEDAELLQIAGFYQEMSVHAADILTSLPAVTDAAAYRHFQDPETKKELSNLIRKIDHLDAQASDRLMLWLAKKTRR